VKVEGVHNSERKHSCSNAAITTTHFGWLGDAAVEERDASARVTILSVVWVCRAQASARHFRRQAGRQPHHPSYSCLQVQSTVWLDHRRACLDVKIFGEKFL
jgi:hypothetical protein